MITIVHHSSSSFIQCEKPLILQRFDARNASEIFRRRASEFDHQKGETHRIIVVLLQILAGTGWYLALGDNPTKTFIYRGFSIATFDCSDYWRVY